MLLCRSCPEADGLLWSAESTETEQEDGALLSPSRSSLGARRVRFVLSRRGRAFMVSVSGAERF